MSLPKGERIKYNGLFLQTYQKGKSYKSKHLKLFYTETRTDLKDKAPLVGFVVPKKLFKKAVDRNKLKRRLREIYRLYRLNDGTINKLKNVGLLVIKVNYSPLDAKAKNIKEYFSYKLLEEEFLNLLAKTLALK
jgi:ribonuclease P protein component